MESTIFFIEVVLLPSLVATIVLAAILFLAENEYWPFNNPIEENLQIFKNGRIIYRDKKGSIIFGKSLKKQEKDGLPDSITKTIKFVIKKSRKKKFGLVRPTSEKLLIRKKGEVKYHTFAGSKIVGKIITEEENPRACETVSLHYCLNV